MSESPMTILGKKMLEDELNHLIRVEREQIKQAIAEARALGDLKENAEYSAAKERQSIIEGRILDVQSKIARARVIDTSSLKTDKIVFGATVKIYDNQKEVELTYQIVGEDEAMADAKKNLLQLSPWKSSHWKRSGR
jgi:transcription elongation factor GreA